MQRPLTSLIIHTAGTLSDRNTPLRLIDKMFLKQELLNPPVFRSSCALE
jgi:hypothetical protein